MNPTSTAGCLGMEMEIELTYPCCLLLLMTQGLSVAVCAGSHPFANVIL